MTIGERIAKCRKEKKLTQKLLAEKLNKMIKVNRTQTILLN